MVDANYCSPCDFWDADEERFDDFLSDRMQKQHTETVNKLSKIVRQDKVEEFAKILAAAYFNECEEAENLAEELDLEQEHFLAIGDGRDDFDFYKKKYKQSMGY